MVGVYIVDDSKLFVNELTLTVPWAELGCRVVGSAVNAFDAEREIRDSRPDLVITDISMPERSGLELIERLGDLDGMEFILISAYSRFEYALKAIKLNTADYFVKPFDDEEFYAAIRKMAERIEQKRGAEPPKTTGGYLEAAVQYVDAHYAEEISAASVAKALFISESYLSKQFRRELNTSFSEYLNYVRIRRSMQLLRATDMMVYEVSLATGFSDPKYFATMFRKYVGVSPRRYKAGESGKKEGKNEL